MVTHTTFPMFAVHTQKPCVTLPHVEDMYQVQDVRSNVNLTLGVLINMSQHYIRATAVTSAVLSFE